MPEPNVPDRINAETLDDYLEVMSRAVFQTGISWRVVESKWPDIRAAFHDFDAARVAGLTEGELDDLGQDPRVIRHHGKLAAIVANARRLRELDAKHSGFAKYLRGLGDFDAALKDLKQHFKFMGPTTCYYFLYVVGEPVPPHDEFEKRYRT